MKVGAIPTHDAAYASWFDRVPAGRVTGVNEMSPDPQVLTRTRHHHEVAGREIVRSPGKKSRSPGKKSRRPGEKTHNQVDNTDILPCDDPNFDRLFKIRPVIEHFSNKFAEVYIPQREICVDESLIHFKGRLQFRQYLPSKRARSFLFSVLGQLYKVTVPVMVTQAPGAPRILQQPVQQYFQNLAQPPRPIPSSQFGGNVQVGQNWPQPVPQISRPCEAVNGGEAERLPDSNFGNANGETFIQQVVDMQNQHVASNVINQPLNGLKQTNFDDTPPPLFSPKQTELTLADNAEALNNLNMAQMGQGQEDYSSLLKSPSVDSVVDLLLLGDDEDENKNIPLPNNNVNILDKLSTVANQMAPNDNEIIQVDGTGDTSSDEELGAVRDIDENEFLGIIDTEDLKALEDDSGSNDSTSNSSDDEDPEIDVIEEVRHMILQRCIQQTLLQGRCESGLQHQMLVRVVPSTVRVVPSGHMGGTRVLHVCHTDVPQKCRGTRTRIIPDPLNSGDDVSEQEVPDLFDTDNVIVCQYDKVLQLFNYH
ncbi:unnamed protein product [Ranitomeya imitator]|uniref:PiggyBac transposable element-derived protein domain-containing protein n=1 Tax=Ranitomeya imitator TaxID=111125 RepID=A0ABN9LQC4_9NEOB|nr:unnamed protein product [Ranitomeya imitator]